MQHDINNVGTALHGMSGIAICMHVVSKSKEITSFVIVLLLQKLNQRYPVDTAVCMYKVMGMARHGMSGIYGISCMHIVDYVIKLDIG